MAVRFQVKVRGRGLGPQLIGCTPTLSWTQKAPLQLQYTALYKWNINLFL